MPDDWYLIALLNLSVQGFSFVDMFHDKAKRAHQGNVLDDWLMVMKGKKAQFTCRSRLEFSEQPSSRT